MEEHVYKLIELTGTSKQSLEGAINNAITKAAKSVRNMLRKLQKGHSDLIGAAVSLEQPAKAETAFIYRARVVAYVRPENVAAVAKEADPMIALKQALSGVERQVRERRDKLRQRTRQPNQREEQVES